MNDNIRRYRGNVWLSWLILTAAIILLGIEFSLLIPKAGFTVGTAHLASAAKLFRSVRIGMTEVDVRNALGKPKAEWQSLSQVSTGGYSPRPTTPVTSVLLVYQTPTSLLSGGNRVYIYLNRESRVSSIVLAGS